MHTGAYSTHSLFVLSVRSDIKLDWNKRANQCINDSVVVLYC